MGGSTCTQENTRPVRCQIIGLADAGVAVNGVRVVASPSRPNAVRGGEGQAMIECVRFAEVQVPFQSASRCIRTAAPCQSK